MRTIAKWASVAGVRVLDTEMRDGKWLISGLAMGTARCPECDELSSRRHGWRIRHLQDLPVQGAQVTLRVKVTRWRCQNPTASGRRLLTRFPRWLRRWEGEPAGLPSSQGWWVIPAAAGRQSGC